MPSRVQDKSISSEVSANDWSVVVGRMLALGRRASGAQWIHP